MLSAWVRVQGLEETIRGTASESKKGAGRRGLLVSSPISRASTTFLIPGTREQEITNRSLIFVFTPPLFPSGEEPNTPILCGGWI